MLTIMILAMIWFFLIVGLVCSALTVYYALKDEHGTDADYAALIVLVKIVAVCCIIVLAGAIGAKAVGL